jgi:hypothetical protein
MDHARFCALIQAYGARPDRWPASERGAAESFLAASPEASALLADQERLDDLLDRFEAPPPSASLLRGVAEIPLRHEGAGRAEGAPRVGGLADWSPFFRLRNLIAAALATGAVGVAVGLASSEPSDWAEMDSQASFEELGEVALAGELAKELLP